MQTHLCESLVQPGSELTDVIENLSVGSNFRHRRTWQVSQQPHQVLCVPRSSTYEQREMPSVTSIRGTEY